MKSVKLVSVYVKLLKPLEPKVSETETGFDITNTPSNLVYINDFFFNETNRYKTRQDNISCCCCNSTQLYPIIWYFGWVVRTFFIFPPFTAGSRFSDENGAKKFYFSISAIKSFGLGGRSTANRISMCFLFSEKFWVGVV